MKTLFKYIVSALAAGLCLLSCSKDPDVVIQTSLEFHKCLKPINFKCTVDCVTITVNLHTFPDAENYELEVYTTNILALPEGEEPDPEYLAYTALVKPEEFPYTFKGPEDIDCYIRTRAVNETKKREPSTWVNGHVKTDVDPETTCATPSDFKITPNYNWITANLSFAANVEQYVIEVYSEAVPSSGTPDPEKLIDSMTLGRDDFPFLAKGIPAGTYYYRIQGRNETAGLKPSKWVRGNFTTKDYIWKENESAFDYNLSVGSARETVFTKATITEQLNAQFGKKGVTAGNTYTWDNITYGPLTSYYDDKWSINRCKTWDKTTYAMDFPMESYEMMEVTRPGTFSFIPRATGNTEDKLPEIVLAMLTQKDGKVNFTYVHQAKPVLTATINTKNEENRITIAITEENLYGIDVPAKLYLFCNVQSLTIYPIKWTRTQ